MTLRARLHTGLWAVGVRHSHFLVLRRPPGEAPPGHPAEAPPAGDLADPGRDAAIILALNDGVGRRLSAATVATRLDRGLRYCALFEEGRAVATTWILPAGERFLEELGAGFPVPHDGLWLRDVWVPPAERGKGRFARLLDAVRRRWPDRPALWSDVRHGNARSLRAHLAYGFEAGGRYEAVHIFARVLLRLRWSGSVPAASDWSRGRRVCLTGEGYRRFAAARRA
ncbi:MAG TPA: GNAT family N-acetyltransferase [Vicinamibacteria bacterium]